MVGDIRPFDWDKGDWNANLLEIWYRIAGGVSVSTGGKLRMVYVAGDQHRPRRMFTPTKFITLTGHAFRISMEK
jgi:hypothetical protein